MNGKSVRILGHSGNGGVTPPRRATSLGGLLRRCHRRFGMALLAASLLLPGGAFATDVQLQDLPLTDQDGKTVRFASEAVDHRIVAINFVYTTCTTLCPLTSATFKQVQSQLKSRLGKEVRLISVSLDPETDTPARLKEYAARYKAGPGWLWLTGEADKVRQVLTGLGAYTADIQQHPPQVLVGDGRSGHWTRFNTLPGPDRIRAAIEQYLKERHD